MSDEETTGRTGDPDEDRAVAAFLEAVAPTLRDEAVWVEPPAGLADSIVAAIAAERTTAQGGAPVVPMPSAASPTAPRRVTRGRRRGTVWLGLAAAAAVVALAVGIVVTRGDGETEEQFAIASTDRFPDASATAVVNELGAGVAIELDITGLPPAPAGFYYQGWVRSADEESVTIGTFHMRAGDSRVTLWSGVDVDEYSTLTVTLQEEGQGAESSGDVVLRGSIVPD
jgi:Anti-sigma-K factor rskA